MFATLMKLLSRFDNSNVIMKGGDFNSRASTRLHY